MRCVVTTSVFMLAGQKYRRGDIVEVDDMTKYGQALDVAPEAPKPKRKAPAKKPKAEEE
jgi:hypothetical protein